MYWPSFEENIKPADRFPKLGLTCAYCEGTAKDMHGNKCNEAFICDINGNFPCEWTKCKKAFLSVANLLLHVRWAHVKGPGFKPHQFAKVLRLTPNNINCVLNGLRL